jgi:hypothetical protein
MGNGDLNHSGLVKFIEEFAKTEFTQLNSPAASELCASSHSPIRTEKWPASVNV